MKIIGVTARFDTKERIEFVRHEYFSYIKDYFMPIVLPMENTTDEMLEMCDCFLVTGGDDINPEFYNEVTEEHSEYVDRRIDLLDKRVIEYAIENNKPLMGICRGLQAVNVFLGGTLHQHILNHRSKIFDEEFVYNGEGRYLSKVFNNTCLINSYHHQAIKDLAPCLVNCGMSNGYIEAVEHKTKPLFAVQWHPEKIQTNESKKLIELLHSMCTGIE